MTTLSPQLKDVTNINIDLTGSLTSGHQIWDHFFVLNVNDFSCEKKSTNNQEHVHCTNKFWVISSSNLIYYKYIICLNLISTKNYGFLNTVSLSYTDD